MSCEWVTESQRLRSSLRFQNAKKELLEVIEESSAKIRRLKQASSLPSSQDTFQKLLSDFARDRGRELYYPLLTSGIGSGPFVELMDGSVKYDMITGIGINFFGHSHPALVEEMIDGLSADVMQGNLEPGIELKDLLESILSQVGEGSRLKHAWAMCSGTMVNEVALKIVRQKKAPATQVLAFADCFAGRSTAMQEITDNPSYRLGQPTYGEVHYLPFYDPNLGLEKSLRQTLGRMNDVLKRYPGRISTLMIELVQGEGGFQYAPTDFYVQVFEVAKKSNIAIWVDEVQTFGRTGELFAYQKFGLNSYVDVVTVGKMLQACLVLFTDEMNPKPGLVAGTFSGSTAAIRSARRVLTLLNEGKFLGPQGRIELISSYFIQALQSLSQSLGRDILGEVRGIGGMIGFVPFQGTMEDVKAVLTRLYQLGVIAFYCGHGPYLVRFLPPLGVMTHQDVDGVCRVVEQALSDEANFRKTIQKGQTS